MAEIVTILQVVSRATRLALSLYHFGATAAAATNDVNRLAKRITEVAVALKQVGASIKDDDSIPSGEATETIQEITHQCLVVFREVETLIPLDQGHDSVNGPANEPDALKDWKWGLASKARMEYLLEHLESLKMTLLVMLQTFYTVKVMRWSRQQTAYTLERTAEAVDNEKMQLQALIMEQQMVLLKAADLHDEYERSESFSPRQRKLLTEWEDLGSTTSSASPTDETSPLALVKYQEPSLASLESTPPHAECLSKVHGASSSHLDDVIERWTRLREIEERLLKIELDMQTQKDEERWERRQNQQPTVESDDSDDELANLPGFRRKIPLVAEPSPYGPSGIHRTFSGGAQLFPGPPGDRFGNLGASNMSQSPRYPISPASSIKSGYSPVSSFDGTAPAAAAAAAATLHDDDDSSDLEIPWRLCTRNNYWEYVDAKVVKTNTEAPPSQAYNDRNAWTEILASWVCKESLEESRFEYAQVQKERREGNKTRFEKGFVIHQALTFAQVEALVERTIELLNQNLGRSRTESTDGEGKSSQAYRGVKGGQGQKNHQQHQPKLDRSLSSPPTSAPAVQQFTPVPASPIQIQPQQNPYASGTFSVPASPLQYQPPNMPQGYSYPSPHGRMPVPAGAPGSPFYPTYLDPSMANRGGRPISRHLSMQDANGREREAGAGFYGGPVSPVNSTHASDEDEAARKERRRRREREREEKDRERDRDRDRDRERDRTRDRDRDRDRERDRDRDKDRDRNRDGSKYDSGRKALGTLAKVGALTALLDGL